MTEFTREYGVYSDGHSSARPPPVTKSPYASTHVSRLPSPGPHARPPGSVVPWARKRAELGELSGNVEPSAEHLDERRLAGQHLHLAAPVVVLRDPLRSTRLVAIVVVLREPHRPLDQRFDRVVVHQATDTVLLLRITAAAILALT